MADRHIGDEAQPALVDAHHRQIKTRQLAGDAQHRAVAAHHDRQIALGANLVQRERIKIGHAGVERGLVLERHLQPEPDQKVRDLFE